jgi:phage baseplate assembly protein W
MVDHQTQGNMMYQISIPNSIKRILKTPLGSRVMNPLFGSKLHELKDRGFNDEFKLKATQYTYEAITKWEKRVKVSQVGFIITPITGVVTLKITFTNGSFLGVAL